MARGRSYAQGGRSQYGRATALPPTLLVNAQSRAHENAESELAPNEGHPIEESRESAPPIDPAVVMEMFTAIQARMDGIEVRIEKQAEDPPLPTPVVNAPTAPQVPSQPP